MLKKPRKLLVASLGVAAVSYACTRQRETPPGNLVAPPPPPPTEVVGNLVAPPPPLDAAVLPIAASDAGAAAIAVASSDGPAADPRSDAGRPNTVPTTRPTLTTRPVGNLMPPPPPATVKK